ncbi:hypothetical protein K525DRAFT_262159 [Schizophyllum commune Loenen D]|nr:hypothetical protein K525DRAFT_262159 [Schizophyllum commune Loenen D]
MIPLPIAHDLPAVLRRLPRPYRASERTPHTQLPSPRPVPIAISPRRRTSRVAVHARKAR